MAGRKGEKRRDAGRARSRTHVHKKSERKSLSHLPFLPWTTNVGQETFLLSSPLLVLLSSRICQSLVVGGKRQKRGKGGNYPLRTFPFLNFCVYVIAEKTKRSNVFNPLFSTSRLSPRSGV